MVRDPYQRALTNVAARLEAAVCILVEDLAQKDPDIDVGTEDIATLEHEALAQLLDAQRLLADAFMIVNPAL